jgi:hypothetical protein
VVNVLLLLRRDVSEQIPARAADRELEQEGRMKRVLIMAVAALLLAGCATTEGPTATRHHATVRSASHPAPAAAAPVVAAPAVVVQPADRPAYKPVRERKLTVEHSRKHGFVGYRGKSWDWWISRQGWHWHWGYEHKR